jgi:hypothetical protein
VGFLDGFRKALGEELSLFVGYPSTRLTQSLAAADNHAHVETTLNFPVAGTLYIAGERIPYTGQTPTTFTGLTRDPEFAVAHPVPATVADGSQSFSAFHRARADRLVTRAEGRALDRLGWEHGERRPLSITDDSYQDLLRVLLYLQRGLRWSLYRVLRAALESWATTATAATDPLHPNRLIGAAGTFNVFHVGRPVEVNGKVYRGWAVDPAAGAFLDLTPWKGLWWSRAAFGDGNPVDYTVQPFRIREKPEQHPGIVFVDLFLGSIPGAPSYLLEGAPVALTPPGWPIGHEILTNELVPGAAFFPWYLPGLAEDDAFVIMLDEVVPAGVNVVFNLVLV